MAPRQTTEASGALRLPVEAETLRQLYRDRVGTLLVGDWSQPLPDGLMHDGMSSSLAGGGNTIPQ